MSYQELCQEAFDDLRKERDYWRDRAYELFDKLECWENGTFRRANAKYWDSWTDTHNEIKAETEAAAKQAEEVKAMKAKAREYQREEERMASVAAAITLNRSAAAAKSSNKKVSFHRDVDDWPTMF